MVAVVVGGGGGAVVGGDVVGGDVVGGDVVGGDVSGGAVSGGAVVAGAERVRRGGSRETTRSSRPASVIRVGSGHFEASGGMNPSGGTSASARRMNAAQIRAGYEPPVTRMPPTFNISIWAAGCPIHAAAVSCGV